MPREILILAATESFGSGLVQRLREDGYSACVIRDPKEAVRAVREVSVPLVLDEALDGGFNIMTIVGLIYRSYRHGLPAGSSSSAASSSSRTRGNCFETAQGTTSSATAISLR